MTIASPAGPMAPEGPSRCVPDRPLRPLAVVAIGLMALWIAAAGLLGGGYLSADTGAKVASLEAMGRGADGPDLGWWAASVDPDGSLHPYYAVRPLEGRWVAVTTLPMLYVARPFYALGGYRAALVVPMVGGLAAALAAGGLARRLGQSPVEARRAVWVVGAATPVAVHALELWEHAWGLALMAWGVVWGLDVIEGRRRLAAAFGCGAAFGLAFALRQEAMVYAAVTVGGLGWSAWRRGGVRAALGSLVALSVGAIATTAGNLALEVAALGRPLRAGRPAGTLGDAGSDLAARAEAALATFAAPFAGGDRPSLALGAILVVSLVGAVVAVRSRRSPVVALVAVGCVTLVALTLQWHLGPAFVPGMVAAAPLSAAGLAAAVDRATWRRPASASAAAIAVGSLPLVWAVQWVQGCWPQWGGRYLLTSMLILVVMGLGALRRHPRARSAFVAASVAVTALGVVTLVERSHGTAALMARLGDQEAVLVFANSFQPQEAGPVALDRLWLTSSGPAARAAVGPALTALGVDRFGFVDGPAGSAFDGYREVGAQDLAAAGRSARITWFELDPGWVPGGAALPAGNTPSGTHVRPGGGR
jgi:hypothetical protein